MSHFELDRRTMLAGLGAGSAMLLLGNRQAPRPLDIAYVNAQVWSGMKGMPLAGAIGISGEQIACLGTGATKARIGRSTRVIDLKGAFVAPGFIDNHTHFLSGSLDLSSVQLQGARTRQQFVEMIGAFARSLSSGQWMTGSGWDAERWGGELPSRQLIDPVTSDTPVLLYRTDGHIALTNSLALKLAGIDRNTPDPEGGRFDRDAVGEPTGIVRDNAAGLVNRAIPPLNPIRADAAMRKGIELALSRGLTQVHCTERDWGSYEASRRLRTRGETGLRFYNFTPIEDWQRMAEIVRSEGRGDDWVRWGGLKGMADGALGSRTALMHQHYLGDPANFGFPLQPWDQFAEWIEAGDRAGLQIAAHAIGDAAIDKVLDIFAEVTRKNGPRDRRFRIEHAQHIALSSISRFGRQGVIPSAHPFHAIDDGRWAGKALNPDQLKSSWPFRTLLDTGARLSFGSDWNVAPLDPLGGIEAAVLRQTTDGLQPGGFVPEQRITAVEALTGYTASNAYAGFQEQKLGTLTRGKLADLVVLAENPLTIAPDRIAGIEVLRTVVGGSERFVSSGA